MLAAPAARRSHSRSPTPLALTLATAARAHARHRRSRRAHRSRSQSHGGGARLEDGGSAGLVGGVAGLGDVASTGLRLVGVGAARRRDGAGLGDGAGFLAAGRFSMRSLPSRP